MDEPMGHGYRRHVEALATPSGWSRAYPALVAAGADALGDILEGLRHRNWRVRRWCAGFLDHFADARCVDALLSALGDPHEAVRRNALHALGCQACKPAPLRVDAVGLLLGLALGDPSPRVRRAAVHMLGNQPPDRRVVEALGESSEGQADPKWAANARWSLGRHAGR